MNSQDRPGVGQVKDNLTQFTRSPVGRTLILAFVAVALNVVAAKIKVSTFWVLVLLLLALVGSLVMESSAMGEKDKQSSFRNEPSTDWLRLIIWALLSVLIGVVVSAIALLPPKDPVITFSMGGNLFGYSYVDWYWYNIFSVAVTSGLAIGIAIPRKSIVKLILFVLFSGTTLFIAAFEFESPILITYATSAIIALVVSALVFYRSMIVDLCREAWGPLIPVRLRYRSKAGEGIGAEEVSRLDATCKEGNERT